MSELSFASLFDEVEVPAWDIEQQDATGPFQRVFAAKTVNDKGQVENIYVWTLEDDVGKMTSPSYTEELAAWLRNVESNWSKKFSLEDQLEDEDSPDLPSDRAGPRNSRSRPSFVADAGAIFKQTRHSFSADSGTNSRSNGSIWKSSSRDKLPGKPAIAQQVHEDSKQHRAEPSICDDDVRPSGDIVDPRPNHPSRDEPSAGEARSRISSV